ncbi:uncharacterized protein PFLUO_LOCUS7280 [Penicillium psychrofluorescens]|uniref:uncharacterized protein n=1 Tax=Penicillium psychrofluorescens TaxID=3158075 RepID=UPI003CCD67B0
MASQNEAAQNGTVSVDESIATKPSAINDVPAILNKIASQGKTLAEDDGPNRRQLIESARSLIHALETPREAMCRYLWSQTTVYAAIETGINIGLFKALCEGGEPKTVKTLATATGAELNFLSRILKHLGAMGVITETGPDTYQATSFAKVMTIQKYADGFPSLAECVNLSVLKLPDWVQKNGRRAPDNNLNCGTQLGYNTDLRFFDYLAANPGYTQRFMNNMSVYRKGRASWMDPGFYPVEERLIAGRNPDAPLIVDIGGSTGHDLVEFVRKYPTVDAKFVLQDRSEVIEKARTSLDPKIEPLAHDFFTEQPVKGARAYYLHSIIHNWPEEKSREILVNLAKALKPGYSKILIHDVLIPDVNADWQDTAMDVIMMMVHAAQERTVPQWHQLVESAGLKISAIFRAEKGTEALIECELP